MGRHVRRFLYLPPGAKPRHRFVIALGTIVLIAFAAMAIVAALNPENGPAAADPNAAASDVPFPVNSDELPVNPAGEPDQPEVNPTGPLLAMYAVPEATVWGTGFQAQLELTNTTNAPQAWQVRLVYPQSVTGFVNSWVDGQPLPLEQANGQEYVFTGALPVKPGQTVLFKVQFDKLAVTEFTATACTINSRPCTRA